MGIEIDNLKNYPKANRDLTARLEKKSEESRAIARTFDKNYFDGSRDHGYGGFSYNPRYWTPVIPDLIERYGLGPDSSVLDVGCAKGFFLHDLIEQIPCSPLAVPPSACAIATISLKTFWARAAAAVSPCS